MRVGARTHAGRIRQTNEDAYHADTALLAVADGMGGHAAGEIASGLAMATLKQWRDWANPSEALRASFAQANQLILGGALSDPKCSGMGTTLTAVYMTGRRLYFAHVGDSRLYMYRAGVLSQLTEDHSIVGELLRIGGLSESEARVHPQRNVLTRALGVAPEVDVDSGSLEVLVGDRLLLCTDGLHDVVRHLQIARVLAQVADQETAVAQLIHLANGLGGRDNVTAILADVTWEDVQ